MIYEFVNPKDPVSILEWKKHRSVIGRYITPTDVLFEAKCSSPEVERALKEFIYWIEVERKESIELLKNYADKISQKYRLELHNIIPDDRIKSDGSYIYNDLKFEIDHQRVMELLMGERLYKSPVFALRELLQNATDAIKVREEIYKTKAEQFIPQITIELTEDTLIVTDNGIGMDQAVFEKYFLQVGKSFYSSPVFYSRFPDVDVTCTTLCRSFWKTLIAEEIIASTDEMPTLDKKDFMKYWSEDLP